MKKYDIAAYVWPSYTGDELRSLQFWEEGYGEWQTVKKHKSVVKGDLWPRKPLWGYVNEANPDIMAMEIEAAVSHGINVFIYDWYWYDRRPFLEQCLNEGFLKAPNCNKMKFYIMWANHDATYLWDKRNTLHFRDNAVWLGGQSFDEFKIITDRIINQYFKRENYYKINDCPVFMVYDLYNLIKGFGGLKETKKALDYFREETVKAGFKGLHLQVKTQDENVDKRNEIYPEVYGEYKGIMDYVNFDSFTHYQMCDIKLLEYEKYPSLPYLEKLDVMLSEWKRIDSVNYKQTFFPHVSVGWDPNPRFLDIKPSVLTDCTPLNIEKALRKAKEYVDTHNLPAPLITLNSWNEWTETSYVQPDSVYGYGYLDAIKKVFIDESNR